MPAPMTRSTHTITLPFPCDATGRERARTARVPSTFDAPLPEGSDVSRTGPRHRSRGNRLPNPRRHGAPRRIPGGTDRLGDVPTTSPGLVNDGLPVGTRVRFERRPTAATTAADVQRAEFAQVAASYVFAAALLACTFLV